MSKTFVETMDKFEELIDTLSLKSQHDNTQDDLFEVSEELREIYEYLMREYN